jgi:hypothetical protein
MCPSARPDRRQEQSIVRPGAAAPTRATSIVCVDATCGMGRIETEDT